MATVLVIYSKLHLADTLVLPNKVAGLQFGLVEHSHGAQNLLDQKMPQTSTTPPPLHVKHGTLSWVKVMKTF